ncbi:MAG: helix-turn-helix domain-containing protein [Methanomicrobiales archaeon]|nr:helix-turn-helix domain-containing protein [Methanomicrobiales archaeon]
MRKSYRYRIYPTKSQRNYSGHPVSCRRHKSLRGLPMG